MSLSAMPDVLAGPILRRTEPQRLVIWLVATRPLPLQLDLQYRSHDQDWLKQELALNAERCKQIPVGHHAWLHLIEVTLEEPLPWDTQIQYDLKILDIPQGGRVADWAPHLLYPTASTLSFVLRKQLDNLLHGSCRKPHHSGLDGLKRVDDLLHDAQTHPESGPALLMLSGDQIYADDVAGPMLVAIHQLIERLGLYHEHLEGAVVDNTQALYCHPATYYQRESLLPAYRSCEVLRERFFGGVNKPIFTTAKAHNHLISFSEVLAMYLLVWSPTPWQLIDLPEPTALNKSHAKTYAQEAQDIQAFRHTLPEVARALAHIQTLMIFDDHDVTDDWNLSASWEETVYQHPFSRRIVGNALLAYLLCQGWGNAPEHFSDILPRTITLLDTARSTGCLEAHQQDLLIQQLLSFKQWHYSLPTQPPLVVLNTRTHRWHHEHMASRPSGLMDWESLCALQSELLDKPHAVIVSPAPIFGVKLIEGIQRLFTWAGYPLMVDAENWMAHRGAAMTILNLFCHARTPARYVLLSGDVHYSFAYRIKLRYRRNHSPDIWQITSSGIKNEFPRTLLALFDSLNRWLYAPKSPLNGLTKRRNLEITPLVPDTAKRGARLWNNSGIGQLRLDEQACPVQITQHNAQGGQTTFIQKISK